MFRVAGICFDNMHMHGLIEMVRDHPEAEIVGVCDEEPSRMRPVVEALQIPEDRVFDDYRQCLECTKPDLAILCPATARHGEWTERVAPYGCHVLVEKPFAATLAEADHMIECLSKTGKKLAINWPLRWYPPHVTTKRLIDEGAIGEVIEVHYYDGNQATFYHGPDDDLDNPTEAMRKTWWYQREMGGGSLLDYLGYGVTLGTWFMGGRAPLEVTTVTQPIPGLDVDRHSITVCRYDTGLSKFETRWGTFTSPWEHQPQPKCGFVVVGRKGTISSYDYERTVRLQTRERPEGFDLPVDELQAPERNPIEYVLHCLKHDLPFEGPLSPELCRVGQQIVETAILSSKERRTVALIG